MKDVFDPAVRFAAMRRADIRLVVEPAADKWGLNDTVLIYSNGASAHQRKRDNNRLSSERFIEENHFRVRAEAPKSGYMHGSGNRPTLIGKQITLSDTAIGDFHFLRHFVEEADLNVNNVVGLFKAAAHSGKSVEEILAWLSETLDETMGEAYTVRKHLGLRKDCSYRVPMVIFSTDDSAAANSKSLATYVTYLEYRDNQLSISKCKIGTRSVLFKMGYSSREYYYSDPVPFDEMIKVAEVKLREDLDKKIEGLVAYSKLKYADIRMHPEENVETLDHQFSVMFGH